MRFWSRNTLRSSSFHGNSFQPSVRCSATAPAIRPELRWYLYIPVIRVHVSLSQALPWAFASWTISPVYDLRLVACSFDESHRRVTPFRLSIFRDLRMMLYAGSFLSGYHTKCGLHGPEPFPFGPALNQRWQVTIYDASTHLHLRYP